MIRLKVVDRDSDHILLTSDEPVRFEVSLLSVGKGCAIIVHGYRGAVVDPEQDPDVTYDGSERGEMHDMEAFSL